MSDELIDQIRDDLERKRALRDRLVEAHQGEALTEQRLADIRASLPEGWTLDTWEYDTETGELNILVSGPPEREPASDPKLTLISGGKRKSL